MTVLQTFLLLPSDQLYLLKFPPIRFATFQMEMRLDQIFLIGYLLELPRPFDDDPSIPISYLFVDNLKSGLHNLEHSFE